MALNGDLHDAHQNQDEGQNHRDNEEEEEEEQQYPLARQSSILALTLDEFQNTMCGPGKTFGSMNMDEFLNNIWTAEEGNAMGGTTDSGALNHGSSCNVGPPLQRQGSLTLPAPLYRKTVDEVWSEIHREQQADTPQPQPIHQRQNITGDATRQTTLGEMTLEDFLVKAGVVREGGGYSNCSANSSHHHHHLQEQQPGQRGLSNYVDPMENERPGYGHVMGLGYDHHNSAVSTATGVYHQVHNPPNFHHPVVMDGSGNGGGGGYGSGLGYGVGRMGNSYASQQVGLGSPASPVSSDGGLGGSQLDYSGAQWGLEMGVDGGPTAGGRKRILDGPVEKVVERRQRRMIKNRESAARSRARKQAYTVELEAELNQLKEENARLEEEQRSLLAKRKQMLIQSMAERVQTNGMRIKAKMQGRCNSCPW